MFLGGAKELKQFIDSNIIYPEEAILNEYSGKGVVSFVVEVDGSISTIWIEGPCFKVLDIEVRRVIKLMPNCSANKQEWCALQVNCSIASLLFN